MPDPDSDPAADIGVPSPADAVPLLVLSLPFRLGGGALGGGFFFAATATAADVAAAVGSLSALGTVGFANGMPCLCFGTSGRGFLGLRPAVGMVVVLFSWILDPPLTLPRLCVLALLGSGLFDVGLPFVLLLLFFSGLLALAKLRLLGAGGG